MVMEEDFDGLDTLEAIQRQNPSQKTIMVSGHSATGRAMAAQEKGAKWLAKPYTNLELLSIVRQTLSE